MSADWEDTVDTQGAVYRHLTRSLDRHVVGRTGTDTDADARYARNMTSGCAELVANAAPIYITSDMLAVWRVAEQAFQPEPLREHDLIVRSGFALLPRPTDIVRLINDSDPHSTEGDLIPVRVRALLWGPWKNPEDFAIVGLGYPDEQPEELGFEAGGHAWAPVLTDGLAIGRRFERRDNCQRAFQALFALMRQFLSAPERLPRSRRRAALRAGLPTEVKIMRLRRVRRGLGEQPGEPVDWNYRWVVEGHWRNQWYPSIGEHRQKWIDGYIKGPEDKPLRDPQRVIGLVR